MGLPGGDLVLGRDVEAIVVVAAVEYVLSGVAEKNVVSTESVDLVVGRSADQIVVIVVAITNKSVI